DPARRGGARVGGGLHGGDVAADDGGHVAGADLLPPDEGDLRGFHHRIGGLNHRDQPLGFDHPERLTHYRLLLLLSRGAPPPLADALPATLESALRAGMAAGAAQSRSGTLLTQSANSVLDERRQFAVC